MLLIKGSPEIFSVVSTRRCSFGSHLLFEQVIEEGEIALAPLLRSLDGAVKDLADPREPQACQAGFDPIEHQGIAHIEASAALVINRERPDLHIHVIERLQRADRAFGASLAGLA